MRRKQFVKILILTVLLAGLLLYPGRVLVQASEGEISAGGETAPSEEESSEDSSSKEEEDEDDKEDDEKPSKPSNWIDSD